MSTADRVYLINDEGGVVYFDEPEHIVEAVANGWHIVDAETYERARQAIWAVNPLIAVESESQHAGR